MAKQLAHVPDCPCETCAEARPAEYRAPAGRQSKYYGLSTKTLLADREKA
jgi:hypothetical protein